MSPALTETLVDIARAALAAGHGRKEAVYAAACAQLGISRATLLRHINEVTVKPTRKQRTDAGAVTLPVTEAQHISAMLMESIRRNNKRLMSIAQAVETLRANGLVRAERLDETTGQLHRLSDNAISRALRAYHLHPDQLLAAAPAQALKSLHPNHTWQIDASLCVIFYLRDAHGLQVMAEREFGRNKPANVKAVEQYRVWRYVITDHASGWIFAYYVRGAENSENVFDALTAAMLQRPQEPLHGAPFQLMMDPGSAMISGRVKNFCRRMQIEMLVNTPGNPRAKGQVENANNLVERSFESGLRFAPVADLEALNAQAAVWRRWFNGSALHGRHGHTRSAAWQMIRAEQLRVVPAIEQMRALLTAEPVRRKVRPDLTVEFQGAQWRVGQAPGIIVGAPVCVTLCPYDASLVYLVDVDAKGHEQLHACPKVERDAFGFDTAAAIVGEQFKRHADTAADTNRKLLDQLATGTDSVAAAEQARKGTKTEAGKREAFVPFGGAVDPFRPMADATLPTYLPRPGTELTPTVAVPGSASTERVLTHFEAATALALAGVPMDAGKNRQLRLAHPDGVPESALASLQDTLLAPATTEPQRAVGGLRLVG
jgi:transposase InsO family protein